MSKAIGSTGDTSNGHKFARDLIRYVLHEHMEGLQWTPTGLFANQDTDTPFTPHMKAIVKELLDTSGHKFHQIYDKDFPLKGSQTIRHFEVCKNVKDIFVNGDIKMNDDHKINVFINLSVTLAYYAGLSYHYGVESAPYDSYMLIVRAVREMKQLGKFTDNMWNELQKAKQEDVIKQNMYEVKELRGISN